MKDNLKNTIQFQANKIPEISFQAQENSLHNV